MSPSRDMEKDPDYTKPPKFSPDVDFHDWRKRVAGWVATIKQAYTKGTDRSMSTKFTLLAWVLYLEALPEAQRSIIDEDIAKNVIDLYSDDDQIGMVLKMLNKVGMDAPIAQVSRLMNTYQTVMTCKRKKDERLPVFAARFRGLSGKHLRHVGASPSSQTGQVLAIKLLNNDNFDENILTNAKMQLISLTENKAAKEAEMKESKKEIVMEAESFDEAVTLANEVKEACSMSP